MSAIPVAPLYTPLPAVCCCPHGAREHEGLIVVNAGCKLHGVRTSIQRTGPMDNYDIQIPVTSTRGGGGAWHRIASGE